MVLSSAHSYSHLLTNTILIFSILLDSAGTCLLFPKFTNRYQNGDKFTNPYSFILLFYSFGDNATNEIDKFFANLFVENLDFAAFIKAKW